MLERSARVLSSEPPGAAAGGGRRPTRAVLRWKALPVESPRSCRPRGGGPEREAERWLRACHAWPVRLAERLAERLATVDVLELVEPLE